MSAPHRRRTLFETARGRVSRCACCDRLELRFGNAVLSIAPAELGGFLGHLEAADPSGPGDAAQDAAREVTLWLGDTGAGWVFSAAEAAELHRLAAGARLMLDVQESRGGPHGLAA